MWGQQEDPEIIAAQRNLEHWFPGVPIWFGQQTRRWWAMAGGGLVDAAEPDELARLIQSFTVQPPRPPARRQWDGRRGP
jgi:hypothetical protein